MNKKEIIKKFKRAFTFAETMIVVGILGVLTAIGIPVLISTQKNLKQTELDQKAEIIYRAVQNNLTEFYANNQKTIYDPLSYATESGESIIFDTSYACLGCYPGDYALYVSEEEAASGAATSTEDDDDDDDDDDTKPVESSSIDTMLNSYSVYYLVAGSRAAENILPASSIDDELKDGHWVIELIPYAYEEEEDADATHVLTAATVYGVFYSEGDFDVTKEYLQFANSGNPDTSSKYYCDYRTSRENRRKAGAKVGYYGSSRVGSASTTNSPKIRQINLTSDEEILKANTQVQKPGTITEALSFKFTFSDASNNSYSFYYDETSEKFYENYSGGEYSKALSGADLPASVTRTGGLFKFTFTLDSLANTNTRFYNLYGQGGNHSTKLNTGTQLTFIVEVSCPNDTTVKSVNTKTYGNSLFGADSTTNKAVITCARHLQNLDKDSGVTSNITSVEQKNNIDFTSSFNTVYKENYYNGTTTRKALNQSGFDTKTNIPNFEPITNSCIKSFDGGENFSIYGLTISTDSTASNANRYAGLFGTINSSMHTVILKNITLIGSQITARTQNGTDNTNACAGALVGKTSGNMAITIENCQVFLSSDDGDVPSAQLNEGVTLEYIPWITGYEAGGLIGVNDSVVEINNSSASTVINAKQAAGGLIGYNAGNFTLNYSYADNYIFGTTAGGLVGYTNGSQATISSCYAAGYIGLSGVNSTGAGIAVGKVKSIKNSYTVVTCYAVTNTGALDLATGELGHTSTQNYYSTVYPADNVATNVYYFKSSTASENDFSGTLCMNGKKASQLCEALGGAENGFAVIKENSGTKPYNLLGQALTRYSYPRLIKLVHYGDWETQFQNASLVYYEAYKDASGNITYGFDGAGITSSLSNTNTIIGDGYGLVFRKNDAVGDVIVNINGKDVWSFSPDLTTDTYYTVEKTELGKKVTYVIYPLSSEITNSSDFTSYYSRVIVTHGRNGVEDGQVNKYYFDYNPHFARSVIDIDADTDEEATTITSTIPKNISIRSPRHLYNLSSYYDNEYTGNTITKAGYRSLLSVNTFIQERGMDFAEYKWKDYVGIENTTQIKPIGSDESNSFIASYNGECKSISNVSFITQSGFYVGMFGYTDTNSTISNVVLASDYDKNADPGTYRIQRIDPVVANETVSIGVLVGHNEGTINNCAVAGYYLSGISGTLYATANGTLYLGGLVGSNAGTITNCEADCPKLNLSMYMAYCYTGGFVGRNTGTGTIQNCYAISHIKCDAQGGETRIAGFAGANDGIIRQTYCSTALTSAGTGTQPYAFAPTDGTGLISSSYYMQAGSYEYVDGLYAYENEIGDSLGTYKTYEQLIDLNATPAVYSYNHNNTTTEKLSEKTYPFRAVVEDESGNAVHYGEWPISPTLGTTGLFYWEYESGGSNPGYKFTYIGTSEGNSQYQTTLCTSHDDGGVITQYGYGYYTIQGEENSVSFMPSNITVSASQTWDGYYAQGNYNGLAKAALEAQVPGYSFFPYTTGIESEKDEYGSYIYLSSGCYDRYGTITLKYTNKDDYSFSYKFSLTPFFANSMRYQNASIKITDSSANTTDYSAILGSENNQFEVRNAKQLQYINWNGYSSNCSTLVKDNNYALFNYLTYATTRGTGTQTKSSAGRNTENGSFYIGSWNQTHDINAENISNFSPIAGQAAASNTGGYNAVLYAWFDGNYNGNSYKISEININSKSAATGLFGVTAGGTIKNIILYSENNAVIQRSTTYSDTTTSYAVGGLIGIAYRFESETGEDAKITNCAIAGYTIQDNSGNPQGLGEANVGGLIGVSNVVLEKCSAVVDIEINATHHAASYPTNRNYLSVCNYGNFIRVGGVSGASQYELTDCYSGGNITVSDETLDENYSTKSGFVANTHVEQNSTNSYDNQSSTNVYLAGICGSGFAMNYQNFTNSSTLKEGSPTANNCYTYMNFPAFKGCIRGITLITSLADRHTWGDHVTISNCYYLSSSAEIDVSQAPTFINKNGINESPKDLLDDYVITGTSSSYYGGTTYSRASYTYLESMLAGRSYFAAITMNNTYQNKLQGTVPTAVTYEELSSSSMPSKLGTNWTKVTTIYGNGGTVDGKYSFPGSLLALSGKNYPFPTIITQYDYSIGENINVHYGEWPFNGAYWKSGMTNFDIFDNMESTPDADDNYWAYEDFTFVVNGDERIGSKTLTANDFEINLTNVASIESVTNEGNGKYTVKVKALKKGTVVITEKNSDADFVLEITANINIKTDKNKFTLKKDEKADLNIWNESSNGTIYTARSEFKVTSSAELFEEGDVGVSKVKDTDDANIKKATITSYGYDGILTVETSYTYNGVEYTSAKLVSVRRSGVAGLSDGTRYVESDVQEDDAGLAITGVDKTYSSYTTNRPMHNSAYDFFLYDTTAAELTEEYIDKTGVSLTVTAVSESHPEIPITITLDRTLTYGTVNDFRTIGGTLRYTSEENVSPTLDDVTLTAVFTKADGTTYTYTLENTTAKSRILYLYQNNPTGADTEERKVIQANNDFTVTIPECDYSLEYLEFVEWSTSASSEGGQSYNPGDVITLEGNLALYARWKEQQINITLYANNGVITIDDTLFNEYTLTYGKRSAQSMYLSLSNYSNATTRAGYTLTGWKYNDTTYGLYETIPLSTFTDDVELYAIWEPIVTTIALKANAPAAGKTVTNGMYYQTVKATYADSEIDAASYVTPTADSYKLIGWVDASGTMVIQQNDDGTLAFIPDVVGWTDYDGSWIYTGEDYPELTAKWAHTYNITYVLNGGTNNAENPSVYTENTTIQLKDPTRNNYKFVGWYTNAEFKGDKVTEITSATEDITLYARWIRTNFKLTLINGQRKKLKDEVIENYTFNAGPNYQTPVKTGYTLLGWYEKNADGTAGKKVLNPDGTLILNVEGYSTSEGFFVEADSITLYAFWGKNETNKKLFVLTSTLTPGKEYLITNVNANTGQAFVANNGNESITVQQVPDESSAEYETEFADYYTADYTKLAKDTKYILYSGTAAIWNYTTAAALSQQSTGTNNNYIAANETTGLTFVTNEENATKNWTYTSHRLVTTDVDGNMMYISYNDPNFTATTNIGDNSSIYIYEAEYVYSEDDVTFDGEKPTRITLSYNKGTKEYELNDEETALNEYNADDYAVRGWTLAGWYSDNTLMINADGTVANGVTVTNGDTYKARWYRKGFTITSTVSSISSNTKYVVGAKSGTNYYLAGDNGNNVSLRSNVATAINTVDGTTAYIIEDTSGNDIMDSFIWTGSTSGSYLMSNNSRYLYLGSGSAKAYTTARAISFYNSHPYYKSNSGGGPGGPGGPGSSSSGYYLYYNNNAFTTTSSYSSANANAYAYVYKIEEITIYSEEAME